MNRTNGGANLLALRSHNTALVLDLLRGAGADGISRLELADRTGLTPQAVSKITARLREEGLAVEAGHRASTGGKRRTVLRLVPGAGHAVGVHLDRDALRAVLVDLAGTVVAERCAALDLGAGAEAVVAVVAGQVEALAKGVRAGDGTGAAGQDTGSSTGAAGLPGGGSASVEGVQGPGEVGAAGADTRSSTGTPELPAEFLPTLLGVGVALPGPLDHSRGVLHRVTGFPEWDGFPLRDALARRLGVPVVVDKDTNAAALGLAVAGERGSFAYLHLGTGLGAGLVIDGAVHRGARTGAGEFGHQVVQLDGPPCGCGDRGCVEALCLAAVARGDLAEAARVLGIATGNLVALLDIDLVLLGGRTIATAPDAFLRGVAAVLDERARRAGEEPVPVRAAPGEVADGAAQLVLGPLFGRADA
ncbi:putative NBD/HSP70 family sugar kinase/biotin operon repressor [Streptomyces canus]|uniref:NBD/HSP70 family sugar kinase/biotin operon repressor n=1 Tax=Streptomyces canus TaxID=58343 RepID=A0AAW8FMC8_9ACTN|nr:putative NBD/HSP70 family sugar kinase/biotin operon repressor [Streptomyces canus]